MTSQSRRNKWYTAVLVGAVALVAAACSGGGGGGGSVEDDPLEQEAVNGERQVNFAGAGGLKIAGTLTMPDNAKGIVPGVVIVSSIGPIIDRDGIQAPTNADLLYKELSAAIVASGVATLRYDQRGVGASKIESGGKKPTFDDVVGDAAAAVKFLSQRREIGSAPIGVVGHDLGGLVALRVAGSESRVKGLALISTPGRPVVDVLAEDLAGTYSPATAEQFRSIVAGLVATGTLPKADTMPSQLQNVLGQGQDQLLRGVFTADPIADAQKVKVPTLVMVGAKSTVAKQVDADRLAAVLGTNAKVEVSPEGPTLRDARPPPPPIAFNPADESTHVFGQRPITAIPRVQASLDSIASYLKTTLKIAP